MAQDMRTYPPDDILCKVVRAAMEVSLETRAPFRDPGVIAASARLPSRMKIRDGQGKWALRQILYQHVPRELIERPQTGFGILGGGLTARLGGRSLVRRNPAARWSDRPRSNPPGLGRTPVGQRDWTHRLWIILMLMAWRRSKNEEH
jgi:asparagine synthase (glutamine-hydrolysing)